MASLRCAAPTMRSLAALIHPTWVSTKVLNQTCLSTSRSLSSLSRPQGNPSPARRTHKQLLYCSPRQGLSPQRHTFTTTATRRKTICLNGPQLDEEGKEMIVEITPRAAERLSEIIKVSNDPGFALRIKVQSGGCHGFQYIVNNASLKDLSSLEEDECIFRYVEDDAPAPALAHATESLDGPKVIMDEASLNSLQGSKIDYTQELIGSKFEVVDNPLASNSCGCGSSFSLKL